MVEGANIYGVHFRILPKFHRCTIVVVYYGRYGNTKTRGKIFVLETFKMFCWFYAAQAHISCGGATALWMELVECFPNKLGKLLCANSCETNDKIICHTNQCTNSRSSILI